MSYLSSCTTFGKTLRALALAGFTAALCLCPGDEDSFAQPDRGAGSPAALNPEQQAVRVLTEKNGNTTRFSVDNREYCEVTMTFEFATKNIKGAQFPCTMVFPPRKVTEAFTLSPEDPSKKWEYSYTNTYKLGSNLAHHDDSYLYHLPYAPGERFKVTQAFGGSFSHKGSNKYAIDWKMDVGTLVCAARGGEVVKVRDDSTRGGPNMSYDIYNNFVLIRHDDGTLGHYCHLLKDSVVVKPGDRVVTGQILAKSGNTGFSSGPHLHFCVFQTVNGKDRESVPIRFRTEGEAGITLLAGRNYKSTPFGSENASTVRTATASATATGAGGS